MNASMNTDEFVKELLISHEKVLLHILKLIISSLIINW